MDAASEPESPAFSMPDEDPAWTLVVRDGEGDRARLDAVDSLLTIGDGWFGARGVREDDGEASPSMLAAGVYDEAGDTPSLLHGPLWTSLVTVPVEGTTERRLLDLRTGVVWRERAGRGVLTTARFLSLARPGTGALRAVGPTGWVAPGDTLRLPSGAGKAEAGDAGSGRRWATTRGAGGAGITAAAATRVQQANSVRTIDRIACFRADPRRAPSVDSAVAGLEAARAAGFDGLLDEQRAALAELWRGADVAIDGDEDLTVAARFAVFQLLTCVPASGEAAVGPRGLSGDAYGGHVLWDADVYVLPVLAAVRPPAARAMLEYRLRRLRPARRAARASGLRGARWPWESGRDGRDITPHLVRRSGQIIPIVTGQHEEHITADVAWSASHYAEWTGDDGFLAGSGRPLLVDAARYWASRIRIDRDGRGHIYGVVGPASTTRSSTTTPSRT